ncbi:MAG TPA: hypothetical protein VGE41_02715 [Verrucomicrobiae bacterium]|jgi:hypothetical protein
MKKRHFLYGLLAWLGLFGLGARWALNPFLWSTTGQNYQATAEQVEKKFPMHVIDMGRSDLLDYAARITNEDADPPKVFNAVNWSTREMQTRFMLLFFLWMGSGFFIHWFMGRIVRGKKSYID